MTDGFQAPASIRAAAPSAPKARLEASRAVLRLAMLPAAPAAESPLEPGRGKSLLSGAVAALRRHPLLATLSETTKQWWATRSWRPIVSVGVEAAGKMVVPMARRYPVRLLAVAMVSGAILSRWRTWKWIVATTLPALAASFLPALISRFAARLPLSTLLNLVGVSSAPRPRARMDSVPPTVVAN